MGKRFELSTSRLVLVGADDTLLRAEIESHQALAAAIDAAVPAAWPPEHHDRNAIDWVLQSLPLIGPSEPWRMFYMLTATPRQVVGTCGIAQAPDASRCVEVGYTVLEAFRGRGFASEAVLKLMSVAFAEGASEVAAETYPSLVPSLRVMKKCGMVLVGGGPGTVRYSKRFDTA